jgi:hypothetical protein
MNVVGVCAKLLTHKNECAHLTLLVTGLPKAGPVEQRVRSHCPQSAAWLR